MIFQTRLLQATLDHMTFHQMPFYQTSLAANDSTPIVISPNDIPHNDILSKIRHITQHFIKLFNTQ